MTDEPREPIGLLAALGLGASGGLAATLAKRSFARRPGRFTVPDLLTFLAGPTAGAVAHHLDSARYWDEYGNKLHKEQEP